MTTASPLREYTIWSEPRGPAFEALLNYCAAMGSHCSLVDTFPHSKKGREAREHFFQSAKPHLIGVDNVDRWPGNGVFKGTVPLWRYRLEAGLLDLLLSRSKGLYGFRAPKLPEDLAAYRRDGSVLLGSVAHEHMGWMNLTAQEGEDPRLALVELRFKEG
jgi:hypothetical protein